MGGATGAGSGGEPGTAELDGPGDPGQGGLMLPVREGIARIVVCEDDQPTSNCSANT